MFEQFLHAFGYPEVGSGVPLETIGLAYSQPLQQFVDEVGSGLFAAAFFHLFRKGNRQKASAAGRTGCHKMQDYLPVRPAAFWPLPEAKIFG